VFGRPLFFYGWIIVGIGVVSMPLIYGTRNSFSVFFPYILNSYEWSRGITAIMLSLNILIYGLLSPIAGSLGNRWKPKRIMVIGVIISGIATGGCTLANELWQFYLLFGLLMPIGAAFGGWPLLAPTLANWFASRRGLVMGLGQMGGGLSFVYSMFAEFVILKLGWRNAYLVLAGVLLAVVLPLYLLFLYYRPEDKGLKAYDNEEPPAGNNFKIGAPIIENSMSANLALGEIMRMYQLWFLVLSYSLYWGVGCYLVLAHQVKFVEDEGYGSMFSAFIFALFGIFMTAGQFSAFISDRIGREKTVSLAAIFSIGALVALLSMKGTSQPLLLYIYGSCFGYGAGLSSPTIVAGTADIFHGKHFGVAAGLLLTGMGVGGAIGPWLGGYIYDVTGSYRSAFILCIVCFVLASVSLWIAAPRRAGRL